MRWLCMSKTTSSWEATYAKRSDDFNSHTWFPENEHANQSCVVRASSSSYKTRSRLSFYFPPLSVQKPPCSSKSWFADAMRGVLPLQNNNMYAYEHCFSDLCEHTQYPQEKTIPTSHVRQTLNHQYNT